MEGEEVEDTRKVSFQSSLTIKRKVIEEWPWEPVTYLYLYLILFLKTENFGAY